MGFLGSISSIYTIPFSASPKRGTTIATATAFEPSFALLSNAASASSTCTISPSPAPLIKFTPSTILLYPPSKAPPFADLREGEFVMMWSSYSLQGRRWEDSHLAAFTGSASNAHPSYLFRCPGHQRHMEGKDLRRDPARLNKTRQPVGTTKVRKTNIKRFPFAISICMLL